MSEYVLISAVFHAHASVEQGTKTLGDHLLKGLGFAISRHGIIVLVLFENEAGIVPCSVILTFDRESERLGWQECKNGDDERFQGGGPPIA